MNLVDALDRYLADAGIGSRYTRRTYRTAMNRFRSYLSQRQIEPETAELTRLHVDLLLGFATWLLEDLKVGRRTLHTYLAALTGFVQFLQVRGWLPFSPQELSRLEEGIKRIRRNQRPPDLMPHPPKPEDLRALVAAAYEVRVRDNSGLREYLAKLRDIAIVEVLASSGLRVGELVGLVRKQLAEQDHSSWVVGKGGKARQVFFSPAAWQALQHYLRERQSLDGGSGRPLGDLPVFARHDRRAGERVLPISTESVQNTIRNLADRAGLADRGITPHALRHYFATRMYQTTRDLAVTQTALGHSSPATTRIYAQLSEEAVRRAHRLAFDE